MAEKKKLDISKHILVPEHAKLTAKDKKLLLEKYNITERELAKISINDAALASLKAEPGDVIKIVRQSPTAGKTEFYRCVANE